MHNSKQTDKVWYAPNRKESYGKEEIDAVMKCLEDGWLAPGELTNQFEREVAAYHGKKYGLFVNSGSSANMLAYICAGIKEGTEVITPACTFSTTCSPLVQLGAKVIFCDVVENAYVPSVKQLIECITPNTKALVVPNLLGNKPDWKKIREEIGKIGRNDIILIEDSCDTMTRTEESDISTVSFYPSHIITAGGTGGMVMFNDEKLHQRALRIRDWGRAGNNSEDVKERFSHNLLGGIQYDWKFLYTEFGYNFKACEMNAAFGLAQMKKLKHFEELRKKYYEMYMKILKSHPVASKYYGFPNLLNENILLLALPLMCKDRMEVISFLESRNIQTRVTMAGNILRHPIYTEKFPDQAKKGFPVSDRVMQEGFLIGCHHGLTEEKVKHVCNTLIEFAEAHHKA